MANEAKFEAAYLALVALSWNELEQVDAQLGRAELRRATEDRLQCLRLELLQLAQRAVRWHSQQMLTADQHARIQQLVTALEGWLDFESSTAPEIIRIRVCTAQDWLFKEASDRAAAGVSGRLMRTGVLPPPLRP